MGIRVADLQREAISAKQAVAAVRVEAAVEAFLAEPASALTHLSHHSHEDYEGDSLSAVLADHAPSVESVFLIGVDDRVRAALVPTGTPALAADYIGLDMSRDPLVAQTWKEREQTWSGVFTSSVTGRRAIALAQPSAEGIALANVSIESLASAIRLDQLAPNSTVVISDRTGNVLFHSSEEVARQRPNYRSVEPIAAGLRGETGEYEYVLDGRQMLGSTAIVDGAEWVVLVQEPRRTALAPVWAVWEGVVVLMLVVATAAVAAALAFSRALSQPVQAIGDLAHEIERGDYSGQIPRLRYRELADLAESFGGMSAAVRQREADLNESQAALAATAAERERALEHVSAMSAELAVAEERERRRLAEELHDRVSQVLAVARMRLGLARDSEPIDAAGAAEAYLMLGEALSQTRAITAELVPPALYEIGLSAALGDLAVHFADHHGLRVRVRVEGTEGGLSDDANMALYRAARELLMNTVKHANTSEAWVTLEYADCGASLTVHDEGQGVQASAVVPEGGFGLFSIRERLLHLGGTLDIESAPGEGYTATVTIPR